MTVEAQHFTEGWEVNMDGVRRCSYYLPIAIFINFIVFFFLLKFCCPQVVIYSRNTLKNLAEGIPFRHSQSPNRDKIINIIMNYILQENHTCSTSSWMDVHKTKEIHTIHQYPFSPGASQQFASLIYDNNQKGNTP